MKRLGYLIVVLVLLLSGCSSPSDKEVLFDEPKSESSLSNKEVSVDDSKSENSLSNKERSNDDKEVVFEDPKFERYIKSFLGNSSEDKVTSQELSNLKELIIDRRFVEVGPSENNFTVTTTLKMDLADMIYFENLQKLEIQNANGDIFYSIDAIGECSELTDLIINYDFIGTSDSKPKTYNDYSNAYGYKTLYSILDNLPKLKKLHLGHDVSTYVIEEINDRFPTLSVTTATEEINPTVKNMRDLLTNVSDLDGLSKDTTVINMYLENGEDANLAIQKAASFEKLTVLRITTFKSYIEYDLMPLKNHPCLEEIVLFDNFFGFYSKDRNIGISIKNNNTLSTIPKLQYLTLGLASISDEDLSELKQLKSITLYRCTLNGFKFLSSCTDLYQLDIIRASMHGGNNDAVEEFIDGMNKSSKIQYFSIYYGGGLLAWCPEAINNMKDLKDFTFIDADMNMYFNLFDFSDNTKLKRIVFSNIKTYEKYDLEILGGLKNLEMLWLIGSEKYLKEEVLLGLDRLQSFYCEKTTDRGIKDLSEVLVQLPKLSSAIFKSNTDIAESEDYIQALYDAGIYEGHYSREDWNKGLE